MSMSKGAGTFAISLKWTWLLRLMFFSICGALGVQVFRGYQHREAKAYVAKETGFFLKEVAKVAPRIAGEDVSVDIIVFHAYNCGPSLRFHLTLDSLRAKRSDVSVTYVPYNGPSWRPLSELNLAVACAASLGHFRSYHSTVLDDVSRASVARGWLNIAQDAGISDLDAFEKCVLDRGGENLVVAVSVRASELGITATPTFFVNGVRLVGTRSVAELEQIIHRVTQR